MKKIIYYSPLIPIIGLLIVVSMSIYISTFDFNSKLYMSVLNTKLCIEDSGVYFWISELAQIISVVLMFYYFILI